MRLGGYEILGLLGKGGMGAVYRARGATGETVAVKLMTTPDPERLARFERERRLLGEVSRLEGFVPLIDGGNATEGPFIVMPLLEGGTLRQRLQKGPLGVEDSLELVRALARALARAHERGIVHRDLKPENVLFDSARNPLIADLGLAKHFDEGGEGSLRGLSLSQSGAFRGTLGYAPPEQASDAKSAGPASDVFALGAILHECLSGRPAFADEGLLAIIARMAKGDRDRLAPGEAPRWLAATVDRALAPDPGERFADAGELLRALQGPRGVPRRPLVLGAAALVGLAVSIPLLRREKPSAPAPPPTRLETADADRRRVRELLASQAPVSSANAPWAIVATAEDLQRAAADRGVVYAETDVASAEANPTLRALALLDAGKRDEAAALLLAAHPTGAALRIREALVAADALEASARSLVGVARTKTDDREARRRMDELAATIPVLGREPAGLVETVLAPLTRVARRGLKELACADIHYVAEFAQAALARWEDRAFLERLPPRLLCAFVATDYRKVIDVLDAGVPGSALARSARLVDPVAAGDPLLAGWALLFLARHAKDEAQSGQEAPTLAAVLAALDEVTRLAAARPRAPDEDGWAELLVYRRTQLEGQARSYLGDPVASDEPLQITRRAYRLAIEGSDAMGLYHWDAAEELARAILDHFRESVGPGELDDNARRILGGHPLAAEVLRRQGKPAEALALLDPKALDALHDHLDMVPGFHLVRALALLDLGRVEEARTEVHAFDSSKGDDDTRIPPVSFREVRTRAVLGR